MVGSSGGGVRAVRKFVLTLRLHLTVLLLLIVWLPLTLYMLALGGEEFAMNCDNIRAWIDEPMDIDVRNVKLTASVHDTLSVCISPVSNSSKMGHVTSSSGTEDGSDIHLLHLASSLNVLI